MNRKGVINEVASLVIIAVIIIVGTVIVSQLQNVATSFNLPQDARNSINQALIIYCLAIALIISIIDLIRRGRE